MKRAILPIVSVLVMVGLAAGVSGLSGLGFWWALLIVVCAFGINGLVATLEDDLPGGFNNPDGMSTPKYAIYTGWVVRGVAAAFGLLAIVMIGMNYWASH